MSSAKLFEMQTLWCSKTKNPEMFFAVRTRIQELGNKLPEKLLGSKRKVVSGTSWIYFRGISRTLIFCIELTDFCGFMSGEYREFCFSA
jgi:predicted transcriptional regulator of viral defense system